MILPAPVRESPVSVNGLMPPSWVIWLAKLVTYLNNIVSSADIEVTGSANGLILESPNGTRWRVQVTNAGALTITSI